MRIHYRPALRPGEIGYIPPGAEMDCPSTTTPAVGRTYECCRDAGHTAAHAAHGANDQLIYVWESIDADQ